MTFKSLSEVRKANKENGYFFFSRNTMKFFASHVESSLYVKSQTFITSEKNCFNDYTRVYSVRKAESDGNITTLARDFTSKDDARDFIRNLN